MISGGVTAARQLIKAPAMPAARYPASAERLTAIAPGADCYQLCAACAPDFPLPAETMQPGQLCRCPLLLREPGSAIRDTLDNTLALASLKAEPVWESVNSLALIKAAEAGLGITILPEKLLSDSLQLKKLRMIHLENLSMQNQMLALFHKDKYMTKPFQILTDRLKTETGFCSF